MTYPMIIFCNNNNVNKLKNLRIELLKNNLHKINWTYLCLNENVKGKWIEKYKLDIIFNKDGSNCLNSLCKILRSVMRSIKHSLLTLH